MQFSLIHMRELLAVLKIHLNRLINVVEEKSATIVFGNVKGGKS